MRLYNVVHILVGTPGRVLDLADKGIANLKDCTTLIMDEVRGLSAVVPPFVYLFLACSRDRPNREDCGFVPLRQTAVSVRSVTRAKPPRVYTGSCLMKFSISLCACEEQCIASLDFFPSQSCSFSLRRTPATVSPLL